MNEDKGIDTVRLTLNLRSDRPRQALILDWLYAACGRSGRFYGLTPRMEAAMFLYRAWSLGQVRIVPMPGLPDATLSMLTDIGIHVGSHGDASGGTAGDGEGFASPTPPVFHPSIGPSVSEPSVSPTDSGTDLSGALPERPAVPTMPTMEIPVEGGEATPSLDDDSPLSRLAKGVKW